MFVLLLALVAGCDRNAPDPPELIQWPMATAASPVVASSEIAWVSPRERTALETTWSDAQVPISSHIQAICRIPDLDYHLRSGGSLREGFLVFHEAGVSHVRGDEDAVQAGPLGTRSRLPAVRAAVCVTPHAGESGEVVALISGGDVPPRKIAEEAETPPWVTSAEIRLAWLQGDQLRVGAPEPLSGANPWSIRAGKFAGEEDNLLVCTYTEAPFDEVVRRRPWIYRIVEGEDGLPALDPRWRGTSFAHPFRDATFGDFTGEREGDIAALEVSEDGGRMVTAYRFEGFGLEGIAPTIDLPQVEERLEAADWAATQADELIVRTSDGRFLFYEFSPGEERLEQVLSVDGPAAVLGWAITSRSAVQSGELVCVLHDGEVWRAQSEDYAQRTGQK